MSAKLEAFPPLGRALLLLNDESHVKETRTPAGLIVPETVETSVRYLRSADLKNAIFAVQKSSGVELEFEGVKYLSVKDEEVLAVFCLPENLDENHEDMN